MGILIVGLVNTEVDRHISKKFQKTEKKSDIFDNCKTKVTEILEAFFHYLW